MPTLVHTIYIALSCEECLLSWVLHQKLLMLYDFFGITAITFADNHKEHNLSEVIIAN